MGVDGCGRKNVDRCSVGAGLGGGGRCIRGGSHSGVYVFLHPAE